MYMDSAIVRGNRSSPARPARRLGWLLLLTAALLGAGLLGAPATARAEGTLITAVSTGDFHTCALTEAGTAKCWGDSGWWQLGNATNDPGPPPYFGQPPVDVCRTYDEAAQQCVALLDDVVDIRAGGLNSHTCALTGAGAVLCWGGNTNGALGNRAIPPCMLGQRRECSSIVPLGVTGLDAGVTAIASGPFHVCALTEAGGVKCWGNNAHGQVGAISNDFCPFVGDRCALEPLEVEGLRGPVTAIDLGEEHSCALISDGTVQCWGGQHR